MDNETDVQETEAPESSTTEVEASPKPSIDDVVSTRMQEAEEKEPATKPESDTTEKLVEKKPETKGERIQRLYREEKERNKELATQVTTLQADIKSINDRLEAGTIDTQQAKLEKQEIVKDAVDNLELSPELEPFRSDLIKLSTQVAESMVAPLLEKERFREQEANQKAQTEFVESLNKDYVELAKSFPALFNEAKEGKLPDLKPEFDKQALEFIEPFNVPYTGEDGKQVFYNPITTSKIGLEMLFTYLNSRFDKAEKAKAETERVERIKRGRVEMPVNTNGVTRERSVEDIVAKRMKQFAT
jgi:hypothetical protein